MKIIQILTTEDGLTGLGDDGKLYKIYQRDGDKKWQEIQVSHPSTNARGY